MNKRLTDYFRLNHTIDIPTAQTIGISRAMLSYLVKTGELQRAAQGLYMPAMEITDDLIAIALCNNKKKRNEKSFLFF